MLLHSLNIEDALTRMANEGCQGRPMPETADETPSEKSWMSPRDRSWVAMAIRAPNHTSVFQAPLLARQLSQVMAPDPIAIVRPTMDAPTAFCAPEQRHAGRGQ